MSDLRMKSNRNSLLEMLRLFAALWVMYYHKLSLITRTAAFSNGRIAVDFFFLLSGFFFLVSYDKENGKKTFEGLISFVWKKFRPLAVTFGICMIFSIAYFIEFYVSFTEPGIWGYLWYVPHLIAVFAFYFLLKRLIKNEKLFFIITAVVSAICYVLTLTYTVDFGIFRGLAGVGYGILISLIPKPDFKNSATVFLIITVSLFTAITLIAIFYPIKEFEDPVCLLILFPAIIYFASGTKFSNGVINKICSVSFGLYAYQSVTRFFAENGIISDGRILFLIVVGLATADVLIKSFAKKRLLEKH